MSCLSCEHRWLWPLRTHVRRKNCEFTRRLNLFNRADVRCRSSPSPLLVSIHTGLTHPELRPTKFPSGLLMCVLGCGKQSVSLFARLFTVRVILCVCVCVFVFSWPMCLFVIVYNGEKRIRGFYKDNVQSPCCSISLLYLPLITADSRDPWTHDVSLCVCLSSRSHMLRVHLMDGWMDGWRRWH